MLYRHKKTGATLKVITEWDNGDWRMVQDSEGRLFTVWREEIEEDSTATKKVKSLQVKDRANKETPRDFPPDTRLNINNASAQMIADHIKGVGIKTAKKIKDLQMSLSGERFSNLDQLKTVKTVDWEAVMAADLIRI
jgi:predicted MPP superfamily phosphohydrolase